MDWGHVLAPPIYYQWNENNNKNKKKMKSNGELCYIQNPNPNPNVVDASNRYNSMPGIGGGDHMSSIINKVSATNLKQTKNKNPHKQKKHTQNTLYRFLGDFLNPFLFSKTKFVALDKTN